MDRTNGFEQGPGDPLSGMSLRGVFGQVQTRQGEVTAPRTSCLFWLQEAEPSGRSPGSGAEIEGAPGPGRARCPGRTTRKMKVLLGILIFVVLSYCDNNAPPHNAINITPTSSYNDSWNDNMTIEITPSPVIPLSCHVCSVDYLCEGPQTCQVTDKFCVIVINVDEDVTSIFKYCSEICPISRKLGGKEFRDYYTGCCVTDLCNFGRLGEGNKLGASIPAVAMALVACLTGVFQIGL
ncbi:uncharacterized protein LOC118833864 [Trichosurus vulpecula]|uniref:uncharacterized protein LOC118833864 n=1 Tax=Trichosurus vulpecula TaxID=9337 RepID=UPI00186AD08C|nr:uncharacterized protein LOC118833864 [Trichosurus vulpecula]